LSTPIILTNFTAGEIAPALFGRVDQARYRNGASTARNTYVGYQGGLYSRAGTAFVGFSKQTGRTYPFRPIPFQFNVEQGLVLEFGNFYMRVVSNGAYVTENVIPISNITQSSPAVITASAIGGKFASPDNTFTYSSYNGGDTITLAGGIYTTQAVLSVLTTTLLGLQLNNSGTSGVYAPADTINLSGGSQLSPAIITVSTTQVVSATVTSGGSGGTNGPAVVTGTTGTGTLFQANVTIASGAIASVDSISVAGDYTVNPTTPAAEPVTGGGLLGATLNLQIGVLSFSITSRGNFSSNPSGNAFTQDSTSGSGIGATFQYGLFGPLSVNFINPGIYTVFPSNPVHQASTSGSGLGAQFIVSAVSVAPFNNGDWVFLSGIGGMTQLNGQTVVVGNSTPTSFSIFDVYGNPINSISYSPYTSGGDAARIYTTPAPYAEEDLAYLKFTQSANVMSLCCVNQKSKVEYPPYDLTRNSDTDWVFTEVLMEPTITPPTSISGTASPAPMGATSNTFYQYCVTAINANDGTESVASPIVSIPNAVDIAATTGSIKLTWSAVSGVGEYYVYKATPGYTYQPPVGALFGFVGAAYGTQFIDSNTVADFTQVPPEHLDPFARGQILAVNVISQGSGYTSASASIISATGSEAVLIPVIVNGAIVAFLVENNGRNYLPVDRIVITGNGTGATASLKVGPQTGTYPAVVSYFQQRRVYANTLNNPDTYFMSQPGSFTNFDRRIPTISTDSIIGSPWSVQVNGIQWLVNMPGGLIALTGLSAWQLTGVGGSSLNPQPFTPSNQEAQPQAYNGCSATVPPIRIVNDIVYVQSKGSIYRDASYNFYTNIYTGEDITVWNSHLFTGYEIIQHAWCEEPRKILWAVRSDGILLSLTYIKEQQIIGWARHDTNGIFYGVCSVTEPPVDALYACVQRNFPAGKAYVMERMDDRLWNSVEDCWCVDCGFQLSQPEPNANLDCSSPYGLGSITGVTNLMGGAGYSSFTTAFVVDDNGEGPGTGAVPTLTIVDGVITSITFSIGNQGQNYIFPELVITDPSNTGSGASARLTLNNLTKFTSSVPIFSPSNIGQVIRMGGGVANITGFIDDKNVLAQIIDPIVDIQPNSANFVNSQGLVQTQLSGSWTMTEPVSTLTNLQPLAGMVVTGLADGVVIPPTVVNPNGMITLSQPASSIIVGLGFQVQIQSPYIDLGEPTAQGQRKKISACTVRIEASLNVEIGCNQVDGSTLKPSQIAPVWNNMKLIPNKSRAPYNSLRQPLYTGDERIPLVGGYAIPGQASVQQEQPLPLQILAVIPEIWSGDSPEQRSPSMKKQGEGNKNER